MPVDQAVATFGFFGPTGADLYALSTDQRLSLWNIDAVSVFLFWYTSIMYLLPILNTFSSNRARAGDEVLPWIEGVCNSIPKLYKSAENLSTYN